MQEWVLNICWAQSEISKLYMSCIWVYEYMSELYMNKLYMNKLYMSKLYMSK